MGGLTSHLHERYGNRDGQYDDPVTLVGGWSIRWVMGFRFGQIPVLSSEAVVLRVRGFTLAELLTRVVGRLRSLLDSLEPPGMVWV